VFVVLEGTAGVSFPDGSRRAHAGDAIVVPKDVDFVLSNDGDDDLRMLCCMPVGGQVAAAEGIFTPPWAE
jgi:mannose-6-phosphate isomerase-like protein (cupin superfamily)